MTDRQAQIERAEQLIDELRRENDVLPEPRWTNTIDAIAAVLAVAVHDA